MESVFIFLTVTTTLALLWLLVRLGKHKSLYPFLPLRYNFGKRRDSFRKTLELLSLRQARLMVETGTARLGFKGAKSNGASTLIFATWASANKALLHTVDISADSIRNAKTEVNSQGLSEYVKWHQQDSLGALFIFPSPALIPAFPDSHQPDCASGYLTRFGVFAPMWNSGDRTLRVQA